MSFLLGAFVSLWLFFFLFRGRRTVALNAYILPYTASIDYTLLRCKKGEGLREMGVRGQSKVAVNLEYPRTDVLYDDPTHHIPSGRACA